MIIESISIKPKAISTFVTLEKFIGGQGQSHKITEAESVKKHIGENCLLNLYTTIFQKLMTAILQDGGYFQHENHFVDSFLQTCAILMILVSNHKVLTMQNLNLDLRNSLKAYFTKYEIES